MSLGTLFAAGLAVIVGGGSIARNLKDIKETWDYFTTIRRDGITAKDLMQRIQELERQNHTLTQNNIRHQSTQQQVDPIILEMILKGQQGYVMQDPQVLTPSTNLRHYTQQSNATSLVVSDRSGRYIIGNMSNNAFQMLYNTTLGNVKLLVNQAQSSIVVPLPIARTVLVGRDEPGISTYPDISLAKYGGNFISRLHLRIQAEEGRVWATDLGSMNGSFINGHCLQAHTPTPLYAGDELILGNVPTRVIGIQ